MHCVGHILKKNIRKRNSFLALKLIFESFFTRSQIGKCLLSNESYYVNFGFEMWILALCLKFTHSYKHPVELVMEGDKRLKRPLGTLT